MEKFQEAGEKAVQNLKIADHMLCVTYPLVKDNKLLMSITENIFLSLTNAMASVLYFERYFKRIQPFHETFESKFNIFSNDIASRYNIDKKYLKCIRAIKEVLVAHRDSKIEFSRGNRFVICEDNYKMRTIGIEELKEFIKVTKEFLVICGRIVHRNGYLYRASG